MLCDVIYLDYQLRKEDLIMDKKTIQQIANRISRRYLVPNAIVTRCIEGKNGYTGCTGYEIRTELPSYEGGNTLCDSITRHYEKEGVIVENCGGCVYFAYIP